MHPNRPRPRALCPSRSWRSRSRCPGRAGARAAPRRRPPTPGRCRDTPGSRSRDTATATGAACRSTAPRARRGTAWTSGRSWTSTTPTPWGEARKRIAVLITADTSDDLVVRCAAACASTTRRRTRSPPPELPDSDATRWRIAVGDGRDRVAFLNGRWHRYGALDGRGGFSRRGKPVTLVTPSGATAYRGRLWSRAPSAGGAARDTVNVVSLENYLRGVVPMEMPALWHPAAVRAQAVAARTYATYERAHPRARHYQICDTWSCQVYGGVAAEHPASDAAVEKTAGKVLTWRGEPALTQFASSSGGWTVSGSVPYLPAQKDPYDGWSGNSVHSWSLRLTDTQLESHWPSIGNLTRITVLDRDGNGDWGGRVQSLRLVGSAGRVTVSGDTFRSVLGLRSDWVTFGVRSR